MMQRISIGGELWELVPPTAPLAVDRDYAKFLFRKVEKSGKSAYKDPTLVTAYRDGVEYGLKQALNLVEGIRRRAWDRAADTGERHHEEVADYIQLFFEELRAKLVLKQERVSMSTIFEGELGPIESKGYREVFTTQGSWNVFQEWSAEGRTVRLEFQSFPDLPSDKKLIVFTENEFNDYLKMFEDRIDASYREGYNRQDGIGKYK